MNSQVAVSILIHGHENYYLSGKQTILSILRHSDFDIFLTLGRSKPCSFPKDPRIKSFFIDELPRRHHRAERFLLKFQALKRCIENGSHDLTVNMDADAIFASPISAEALFEALGKYQIGMVEQKTIKNSSMSREDFLNHYRLHTLPLIAPDEEPPNLEQFRYYNSGFVLGKTAELYHLASWATQRIDELEDNGISSQIGEHMIADQDYFQYWVNNLYPQCCAELPWYWNHCDLWDEGFPRTGARVIHFSNFCLGPDSSRLMQIQTFGRSKFFQNFVAPMASRLRKARRWFSHG